VESLIRGGYVKYSGVNGGFQDRELGGNFAGEKLAGN
jgi:hypothetical protein